MRLLLIKTFVFLAVILTNAACRPEPYYPDYTNAKGFVIGSETCHTDEGQDYWLIDFTYRANSKQVGDTLVLNGTTYTNVLKVKGLHPLLKVVGMKVSIDYKTITPQKVISTGCDVASPVTYPLKEMFIMNQGEIRG
jgi:hypothetical protein